MFGHTIISTLAIAVPALARGDHNDRTGFPARSAAGLALEQRRP